MQSHAKAPIKFAQVALPLAAPGVPVDPLEVRLADGTELRGNCVGELVELVRALRG